MGQLVIQGVINGIILGMVYGLVGMGLNVIFGVLRVVNFAHGEFAILGAYFAYFALELTGLNPFIILPVAFFVFVALGVVLYYLLVPRLARSDDPETSSLLVMFGVSIMLGALMLIAFEADARSLNYSLDPPFLLIGDIVVPTIRLVALGIVLATVSLIGFFLYRTLPGKALRAIIMNRDAVQIVGINVQRLSAQAFGLGIGLAGITGVLVAMIFPAFSPFAGVDYTLIGFIVIVLGGLGHPIGALIGAILFGVTEQVSAVFFSSSIALILGFLLLIVTIFIRPAGLFGKQALR
jgi:branched-chain amino acid transport system permease protein